MWPYIRCTVSGMATTSASGRRGGGGDAHDMLFDKYFDWCLVLFSFCFFFHIHLAMVGCCLMGYPMIMIHVGMI